MLLTRPEPFEIRRAELAAATSLLGVSRVEELGYPEQRLPEDPAAVVALHRLLRELSAGLLLVPHAKEMDRDHHMTNRLAHAALGMLSACGGALPAVWEYEVWTTIESPGLVVDVTAVVEEKRAAILRYGSQLAERDHAAGALGLNAYRASTLGRGRGYAEAFGLPEVCGRPQERACTPLA